MKSKFSCLLLMCISMAVSADYVVLDQTSTQKWEYNPGKDAFTYQFNYQVNRSLELSFFCDPIQGEGKFKLILDGRIYEEKDLGKLYGYDSYYDLAQNMGFAPGEWNYGDFAHFFAQYETIWFTDKDGKELTSFPNDNRMAANELFSFRKECRAVVLDK
ncbi:hypothetical protein [Photobacterium phage PDCC-1]|uniref:Uncharacterized protein n=1 Tax=Photobacterium phage PDCC-1 TaxID=2664246 RepID=A0A6B9J1Z6_9CAUD|nr:hypothetical protein HWC77_gp166 [Photobacterium phage PDCC-1]QGZ14529.1 hypothetical protein [Photobacterium phage PDCC-1]